MYIGTKISDLEWPQMVQWASLCIISHNTAVLEPTVCQDAYCWRQKIQPRESSFWQYMVYGGGDECTISAVQLVCWFLFVKFHIYVSAKLDACQCFGYTLNSAHEVLDDFWYFERLHKLATDLLWCALSLQPADFDVEELLSEELMKAEDMELAVAETDRSLLESPDGSISHADLGQLPIYQAKYSQCFCATWKRTFCTNNKALCMRVHLLYDILSQPRSISVKLAYEQQ